MTISRRTALALPLLAAPRLARAAEFPDRPIRFICPYAPGGNADVTSRILSAPLAAELGQPAARPLQGGLDTAKLQRLLPKCLRPLHEWLADFVVQCDQSRFDGADLPVTPPDALGGP